MVDKRMLEQLIAEQKEEMAEYRKRAFCTRHEEQLVDIDSNLAQVIIGVRRCGKSVLCYNLLHKCSSTFAYVNFDDERLFNLQAADLNDLLEALYKSYGQFTHLFLDEIQNIEGWQLFVNRLLRQGLHILMIGSNAKLLSSELATHLTGRHIQVALFPLSFDEYCRCKGVDTQSRTTKAIAFRRAAYDSYLGQGGFPELLHQRSNTQYVNSLVNSILERDIIQRFKIKNVRSFTQIAHHLMNIAPAILNEKDLGETFGVTNMTAGNYVEHLKQAYLLVGLKRYSTKSKQRIRNEKIYPIDVALMDGRQDAMAGANLGWRLETQVYIELLRRNQPIGRDIYYFRSRTGLEADFVVCRNNSVEEIYQVSYDLSKEKTLAREIRGLLAASAETHCNKLFLITDHEYKTIQKEDKTIEIIPAYDWMVDEK